ncbi:MAG: hypothetical protein ABIR80_13410 [Opitutaceae bacterium]
MKKFVPARGKSRNQECRTTAWWAEHFRRDLQRDWTIPWESGALLVDADVERIAASIAEFQRGESAEARTYLARSERFSRDANDPAFHEASKLFIQAENAHAALLLRFMERTGIPRRENSSRYGVFRWLRHLGDLGWASRVLLVAELIAQEYYPCLRRATDHPALVRICDRIVAEEMAHIRFQVERIARVETAQSRAAVALRDVLQGVLMAGAACVVYAGHRRVLAVRLSCGEFLSRVFVRQRRALAAMCRLRAASAGRRERNAYGALLVGATTGAAGRGPRPPEPPDCFR